MAYQHNGHLLVPFFIPLPLLQQLAMAIHLPKHILGKR